MEAFDHRDRTEQRRVLCRESSEEDVNMLSLNNLCHLLEWDRDITIAGLEDYLVNETESWHTYTRSLAEAYPCLS